MIPYQVYKLVHFAGLMLLFLGLGGLLVASFSGIQTLKTRAKILSFTLHGVGLLLILIGGFGMLARLGIVNGLPAWVYGKLFMWLILGAGVSMAKRADGKAWLISVVFVTVGVFAALLALYKPFA